MASLTIDALLELWLADLRAYDLAVQRHSCPELHKDV